MIKKLFYTFAICCSCLTTGFAEQPVRLSKQQMTDDFTFLYHKIEMVTPHLAIRKQVTGYDVLAEIQGLRSQLDTVTSEAGFAKVMWKAIALCRDPHNTYTSFYPYNDTDTSAIATAVRETRRYQRHYFTYNTNYALPLFYVEGDYFLPTLYFPSADGDNTEEPPQVKVAGKSKLLKEDNMPIDEYNATWNFPVHPEVRWDYRHNKYYAYSLFSPHTTMNKEQYLTTISDKGAVREEDISVVGMRFPSINGKYTPKVHYFANDAILYIRVPAMDAEKIAFYQQELRKYKTSEIKKVVIDVRDNGGGNDVVWQTILASVVKHPLAARQRLCFRNNRLVREYLTKDNISYTAEKPLIIGHDSLFCIEDVRTVMPDTQSLGYDGNIYVLLNEDCYSSTLALSSFCETIDNMITVGTPTGWLGGEGVMPFYFILPHSKLIFSLACSLDGNVSDSNPAGYYHDQPKIPVSLSLDDYYSRYYYPEELYEETYLYHHDPVFQKVLEQ